MNRLLKLYTRFIEETSADHDVSILQCLDICYFQKMNLEGEALGKLERILSCSGLIKDDRNLKQHFSHVSRVRV